MGYVLRWGSVLAATWWLWSGHTSPLMVAFGVVSIALVLWIFHRMDNEADEHPPYRLGWRPVAYLPYLLWEIIKSNLYVARLIISPTLRISPKVFRTRTSQKTIIGQVIYANSITLTPGTVTLDLRDGEVMVHALTEETAAGVLEGSMDRRCARLEGKS